MKTEKNLAKMKDKMMPETEGQVVDRIRVEQKGEKDKAHSLLRALLSLHKLLRVPPNLLQQLQAQINLLEMQCRSIRRPGGGQIVPALW